LQQCVPCVVAHGRENGVLDDHNVQKHAQVVTESTLHTFLDGLMALWWVSGEASFDLSNFGIGGI
jgi:hypothetical protein